MEGAWLLWPGLIRDVFQDVVPEVCSRQPGQTGRNTPYIPAWPYPMVSCKYRLTTHFYLTGGWASLQEESPSGIYATYFMPIHKEGSLNPAEAVNAPFHEAVAEVFREAVSIMKSCVLFIQCKCVKMFIKYICSMYIRKYMIASTVASKNKGCEIR